MTRYLTCVSLYYWSIAHCTDNMIHTVIMIVNKQAFVTKKKYIGEAF